MVDYIMDPSHASGKISHHSVRLGWIRPGYDADLVVWDSHPLALGATPLQVVADGTTLVNASEKLWEQSLRRPQVFSPAPPSRSPTVINNEKTCVAGQKSIVLRGITKSHLEGLRTSVLDSATAVVLDGQLQCVGGASCTAVASAAVGRGVPEMHLKDGYILPVRRAWSGLEKPKMGMNC